MQLRSRAQPAPGLAAALLLLLAACRHPAGGGRGAALELAWKVTPAPPRVGRAELALSLTDKATGRPAAGARVRVEADMSHPGMQPVIADAREVGPGRYAAPLSFTMAGDWSLEVAAELPDGRTWKRQLALPGVGAPSAR
jgi:hypothetical protein